MKKQYNLTYTIAAIAAVMFFIFFSYVQSGGQNAFAATVTSTYYEQSNVLDDLEGSTIDGKPFSLEDYNFDKSKGTQILSFIEFGYSYYSNMQHDYGLYVYVYNPQRVKFVENSTLNKISLRAGGNESDSYNKYNLEFLNHSTATGTEGLFLKYKIALSEAQRKSILNAVSSYERVYEVSEIELLISGSFNAKAYNISNKYTYTGYAEGYGSVSASGDSLSCTSKGTTTLTLDVHPATYRLDGSNGSNDYTQDSLDSVYFAIPNEIISEYGGLTAVHAIWLNALIKPVLVTGNKDIYNALYDIVWEYRGSLSEAAGKGINFDYCLGVNAHNYEYQDWVADLYYADTPTAFNGAVLPGQIIDRLYYLFYAESGNADDYILTGAELLNYIQSYGSNLSFNDCEVAGKYSSELFESWDKKYTEMNIQADDEYSLIGEKLTQKWWQKLFGMNGTEVANRTTFDNIEAIHEVVASDFKSNVANTCKALFIGESYYKDFKAFYDKSTQRNETVYILRYEQSDYQSREVTEFTYGALWGKPKTKVNKIDSNAYYAQEWLHLDFDIIDVTFTKGDVDTVIGVVSSPKDIVPDITPPLITTQDGCNSKQVFSLIMIVVGSALVVVLIAKLIIWIVGKVKTSKKE